MFILYVCLTFLHPWKQLSSLLQRLDSALKQQCILSNIELVDAAGPSTSVSSCGFDSLFAFFWLKAVMFILISAHSLVEPLELPGVRAPPPLRSYSTRTHTGSQALPILPQAHVQTWLRGCMTCAVMQGPCRAGTPHGLMLHCGSLEILNFWRKGSLHFHFVLGSTHCVADPAYLSIFSTVDELFEVRGYIFWSSWMHIAWID